MKTVRVKKAEVLACMKSNVEQHVREYQEACAAFRTKAAAELEERAAQLRRGETVSCQYFHLPAPESHEKDYKQAIGLLTMAVDETIELDMKEYQSYVLDQWDWQEQFKTVNSTYTGRR